MRGGDEARVAQGAGAHAVGAYQLGLLALTLTLTLIDPNHEPEPEPEPEPNPEPVPNPESTPTKVRALDTPSEGRFLVCVAFASGEWDELFVEVGRSTTLGSA